MLPLNLADLSGCNSSAQTLNAAGSSLRLGSSDTQVNLTDLPVPMVPKPGLREPALPHEVTSLYSSLHIAVRETTEGWGPQQEAFPSDSISRARAGCTGHKSITQGVVRAQRTKKHKRERLDGLERWEGDIRCTRKAGGSAHSPERESKLSQRQEQMEVNSSSLNGVLAFGSSRVVSRPRDEDLLPPSL